MNDLLDLRSGQWKLLLLPPQFKKQLLIATAQLAERGPLMVLDCGRQYDASIVGVATGGRKEIANRIQARHAFICFEVVKMLQRTPEGKTPVLVLDFLSSFCDENVQFRMRQFLLEQSLRHFQRLSRGAGLAVSVSPPPPSPDAAQLFARLQSAASQILAYEMPVPKSLQPGLF